MLNTLRPDDFGDPLIGDPGRDTTRVVDSADPVCGLSMASQ